MTNLDELENKSIYIIREAYKRFKNPAVLWSVGKDSTTLLWLCRNAFFGKVPFPVIHIDTTYKFPEMYKFRDYWAKKWKLDILVEKNQDALDKGISYDTHDAFTCCHELKTVALKKAIKKHGFDALLVGIRRDEHGIRGKERYFSPRDKEFRWNIVEEKAKQSSGDSPFVSLQDTELDGWNIYATDFYKGTNHVRVHPLLHWTELEIWQYIQREKIPIVPLYFSKNGKRYRSLGCMPITKPVDSNADSINKIVEELKTTKVLERSGRAQDKENEYNMQKLRSLGYM